MIRVELNAYQTSVKIDIARSSGLYIEVFNPQKHFNSPLGTTHIIRTYEHSSENKNVTITQPGIIYIGVGGIIKVMSRSLTKTTPFIVWSLLEHPKVPHKLKDFLI